MKLAKRTNLFAFNVSMFAIRSSFDQIVENRRVGSDADAAANEHGDLVGAPLLVAIAVGTVHVEDGKVFAVRLGAAYMMAQFPRPRSDRLYVHLQRRLLRCGRQRKRVSFVEVAAERRARYAHPLARSEPEVTGPFEFNVDNVCNRSRFFYGD